MIKNIALFNSLSVDPSSYYDTGIHGTFDDYLIKPKFSTIKSRKDVNTSINLFQASRPGLHLNLPVISANMATITGSTMASQMAKLGCVGALHRFWSIEDNVKAFVKVMQNEGLPVIVSVGLGDNEKERIQALYGVGANMFCIDVANGAQMSVVEQVKYIRETAGNNAYLIVGNFATHDSIEEFNSHLPLRMHVDSYKVGIGPSGVCSTRLKTGVGVPQLAAIMDCSRNGRNIIADGGLRSPGDIVKALAAGANAVMVGNMLSGTKETPGEVIYKFEDGDSVAYKEYSGSADNGYGLGYKTSEGVSTLVKYKGPIEPILKDIEGGLRSAMTYTNSRNLTEFSKNAQFIKVSVNTKIENTTYLK